MRKPSWRKAPTVQIESPETEECLDDGEETAFEREEKERDQYPNRMTAEEIDDIIEGQLRAYEAEWERILGFTETSRRHDAKVTSAKVVRRECGQVVEIKHGELFLRVCAHLKRHVELPSLRQISPRAFEVCVPGIVLGVPPAPAQSHQRNTDPTDVRRFLGETKARWSGAQMIVSVCRDEASTCGVCLRIKTYGQELGAVEVKLRAVGGWSQFPTLRIGGGKDSVEVDISRLVLDQADADR